MAKNIILIAIILAVAFIAAFYFLSKPVPMKTIPVKIADKEYNLEVAKTVSQQSNGLSNRTSLCPNCGMVFVFGLEGTLPFWMKDTLIPLDIIWINSKGYVVSIQTAAPEPNTPNSELKIYQNTIPAKYVIELNAGDAQKLGLKVGDKISLNL
jgi:uncharacterized membrane protein (UPF0127 family)